MAVVIFFLVCISQMPLRTFLSSIVDRPLFTVDREMITVAIVQTGLKKLMKTVRIATRQSQLALWQAGYIKDRLERAHGDLRCEIVGMTTEGDRNKISPLSQMGGKGVFVKELETALIDGRADIAVHSMKDVPGILPLGLGIHCICERANPRDAFVSNHFQTLAEMPVAAVVGSSSLRRILQISNTYPDLKFEELRGNVDTRLKKLDGGHYDAIILAVAGLDRLGLSMRVSAEIASDLCVPAAGQGAVGVECRDNDEWVIDCLRAINDEPTRICVEAERAVTLQLGATCNLPIAAFAEIAHEIMSISAFVSDTSGDQFIKDTIAGPVADAVQLALTLGQRLIDKGALDLVNGDA